MCVEIMMNDEEISTCGELAKALGVDIAGLPLLRGYGLPDANCCLCPVDVDAAADMVGMTARDDGIFTAFEPIRGGCNEG